MKPIKALLLKISLLFLVLSPFAYITYTYSYCYSILSGDLAFDPNLSTKIYDINGAEIAAESAFSSTPEPTLSLTLDISVRYVEIQE